MIMPATVIGMSAWNQSGVINGINLGETTFYLPPKLVQ